MNGDVTSQDAAANMRSPGDDPLTRLTSLRLPDVVTAELRSIDPQCRQVPPRGPARAEAAMRLALWQAAYAFAEDEVPVGAVVVNEDGAVIGLGRNLREQTHDPTDHAEVVAVRQASACLRQWRLDTAELVVTLEPCPMCAGALINARIAAVTFGAHDPKAGACGSVLDLSAHPPLNHSFPLTAGVLDEPCAAILREYFRRKRRTPGGTSVDAP